MKFSAAAALSALLLLAPAARLSAQTLPAPAAALRPPSGVEDVLHWASSLGGPSLPDTKLAVKFDDLPVRDALKRVLEQAKQDYVIDDDVPASARISLDIKDVQLSPVLDLLTQSAGVGWRREVTRQRSQTNTSSKTIVRVGKSVATNRPSGTLNRVLPSNIIVSGREPTIINPFLYRYSTTEQRSTFTCPHCKGQATLLQTRRAQPACPKCQRTFQSDWQFCPSDGTKRPAATTGAWRFCPLCGKTVSLQTSHAAH